MILGGCKYIFVSYMVNNFIACTSMVTLKWVTYYRAICRILVKLLYTNIVNLNLNTCMPFGPPETEFSVLTCYLQNLS